MLNVFKAGGEACVTFSLLDGLVMARSAFHHSANYRSAVVFGQPTPTADPDRTNAYVANCAKAPDLFPLMITGRDLNVPADLLRQRLADGGFRGYKVYLNWVGNNYGDHTVEQMIGPNEMQIANDRGLIVLLHVPRTGRLADPAIQAGVEQLAKDWPNAQIVLAHAGRCYLPVEMRAAAGCLRNLENVHLDLSMVMDPLVILTLLDNIGPSRLLFATDFPVAAMRGRRVHQSTSRQIKGKRWSSLQQRPCVSDTWEPLPSRFPVRSIAGRMAGARSTGKFSALSLRERFTALFSLIPSPGCVTDLPHPPARGRPCRPRG